MSKQLTPKWLRTHKSLIFRVEYGDNHATVELNGGAIHTFPIVSPGSLWMYCTANSIRVCRASIGTAEGVGAASNPPRKVDEVLICTTPKQLDAHIARLSGRGLTCRVQKTASGGHICSLPFPLVASDLDGPVTHN